MSEISVMRGDIYDAETEGREAERARERGSP